MQLIYTGKTKCCHPQGIEFPFGFGVTHSFNYWSNEELAIQHIREIILSYADKIKEELGLSKDQKSSDLRRIQEQTTKRYTDLLLKNDLVHVHVPGNLT